MHAPSFIHLASNLLIIVYPHDARESLPASRAVLLQAENDGSVSSTRGAYLLVTAGYERMCGRLAHAYDAFSSALRHECSSSEGAACIISNVDVDEGVFWGYLKEG